MSSNSNHAFVSRFTRLLAAALTLLIGADCFAIDTQTNLPIEIASDSAVLNEEEGFAKYQGNVIIEQGGSKLEADVVSVSVVEQTVKSISAQGSPARFQEGEPASAPRTLGTAKTIEYSADKATLLFQGDASLIQKGNTFSGERIVYDINKRAIRAQGNDNGDSRVKIKYRPAETKASSSSDSVSNSPEASEKVEEAANSPSESSAPPETQDSPVEEVKE